MQSIFWTNDTQFFIKEAMKRKEVLKGIVYKVEEKKLPQGKQEIVYMDLEGGIKAYCSEEEFDAHSFKSLKGFVGHSVDVVILNVVEDDELGMFAVVSRKQAEEIKAKELLARIQEGDFVNGTISGYNEEKNTIFVDIGGVDAFCYLEDWDYIRTPSVQDAGPLGMPVTVVVTKIASRDPLIIRVSRKEASKDPWEGAEKRFPPNSFVLGKVSNVDDRYGIFVTIDRGVTIKGYIPTASNLSKPIPGQPVNGRIMRIDEKERRGAMLITNYPHGELKRANPGAYLFE